MKHLLLFLILLTFTGQAQGQTDFRQRQLTMDDGLPSNSVRSLLQDQRGFIWMGTEGGLCRFDGRTITPYTVGENVLQHITALTTEGTAHLLVGTNKGVYQLSLVTEQTEQLPLKLNKPVSHLTHDKDGQLWVSTLGQGIAQYTEDEKPQYYAMSDCKGMVNQVYIDSNNQIWALCGQETGGLWWLNKTSNTFERVQLTNTQDAPADPTCMLETSDHRRWVGTWEHGLWMLSDNQTLTAMPTPATGHSLHIHAMTELSAHELLLCCDDGLWLFDTITSQFSLYMPQRFVYCAISDTEHGLWVGTYYGGATYESPISRRFDATPGGLITSLAEDRHGRIWVAGDEQGISCYQQGKRLDNLPQLKQLKQLNAHALCIDGDDLWIGTYSKGLYVMNINSGQLTHYTAQDNQQSLYDDSPHVIYCDQEHRIWVATNTGLCRYNRENQTFDRITTLPSLPMDIDQDKQGYIWIATQGSGVIRCNTQDGTTRQYQHKDKAASTLANDIVNCMLIDQKGRIWVGTQGGLSYYDAASDQFQTVRLDVPRQAVASIIEDQGTLWLAGDCGVLKYSEKEGLQRFTRQDGLLSEQFQPNAAIKASNGRIYLGTIRGFNSFFPHKIMVNQQLPPVYITHLEIGTTPIPVGDWHLPMTPGDIEKLDLWYNDRVFSLSFASLSYCSPEKNIYAYMLEGFDKDWNYVDNNNRATYTNLPAGEYTFRVKATNNDGIWSTNEARLKIVMHPPYWWSTPAKIFYVILAIALIWAFIWLRLKLNERRHRKDLQALNEQKEEEMQQARMEFFTTIAHEIRTPVSLIIGPLEQLKERREESEEKRRVESGEKRRVESGERREDTSNLNNAQRQTLNAQRQTLNAQRQTLNAQRQTLDAQLDIIDRNAHRLLDLVNQLLDFRKVGQQNDMHFQTQNINQLLQTIANDFAPAFKSQGRQFTIDLPAERITAAVDSEGLRKVVSNLLSNANKYTHDCIILRCKRQTKGNTFTIEVSDNGMGIAKEHQKHLFEPFYQVTGSKPGTGIGLNIVKRIAEAHHGEVAVKSEKGQGTTFIVTLPLRQEVVTETPAANAAATDSNTQQQPTTTATEEKKHMLIVDDNEDMLTFLVTTFMDNYNVTPAHNGEEALRLVSESLVVRDGEPASAYDIVISDWMMEKMEGPELCSRLRQNPATSKLPFILLTAKTDSQSKVIAMEQGVDAFIEKPFNVKYLEACIRNLLNRK